MENAATGLADFLANVGTTLSSAVGWMSTIGTAVVETPILLVPFALGIAMTGVALFKSLSH